MIKTGGVSVSDTRIGLLGGKKLTTKKLKNKSEARLDPALLIK
jgi:hypothetical protein